MGNNEISNFNTALKDSDDLDSFNLDKCLNLIHSAFSVATFIYGVISWCLIRKFRNFNNYVYLSAILVNLLRLTLIWFNWLIFDKTSTASTLPLRLLIYVFLFLTCVYNYWLLVMCYMFYKNIVKVFDTSIKRKYLYSTLFAWGVPLIVLLIFRLSFFFVTDKLVFWITFVSLSFYITCSILPASMNLFLFIKLVFALYPCNGKNTCAISSKELRKQNLRRLCTAIVMFFLSNIVIGTFIIWALLKLPDYVLTLLFSVQTIVLAVFVPLVKSNRGLWHEYYKNRFNRNMSWFWSTFLYDIYRPVPWTNRLLSFVK